MEQLAIAIQWECDYQQYVADTDGRPDYSRAEYAEIVATEEKLQEMDEISINLKNCLNSLIANRNKGDHEAAKVDAMAIVQHLVSGELLEPEEVTEAVDQLFS